MRDSSQGMYFGSRLFAVPGPSMSVSHAWLSSFMDGDLSHFGAEFSVGICQIKPPLFIGSDPVKPSLTATKFSTSDSRTSRYPPATSRDCANKILVMLPGSLVDGSSFILKFRWIMPNYTNMWSCKRTELVMMYAASMRTHSLCRFSFFTTMIREYVHCHVLFCSTSRGTKGLVQPIY
jgi:hypothetical protein